MQWSRALKWAAVLLPAGVLFLVLSFLMPGSPSRGTIHVVNPRVFVAFLAAAGIAGFAILVASVVSFISASPEKTSEARAAANTRGVILLLAFVLYLVPFYLVLERAQLSPFGSWKAGGSATDASGDTWCFLHDDCALYPQVALGKLRERTLLASSYQVMAKASLKEDKAAHIPAPEGSSTTQGRAFISKDGMVLGILGDDTCYLAYDMKEGRPLTGSDLFGLRADIFTRGAESDLQSGGIPKRTHQQPSP